MKIFLFLPPSRGAPCPVQPGLGHPQGSRGACCSCPCAGQVTAPQVSSEPCWNSPIPGHCPGRAALEQRGKAHTEFSSALHRLHWASPPVPGGNDCIHLSAEPRGLSLLPHGQVSPAFVSTAPARSVGSVRKDKHEKIVYVNSLRAGRKSE